MTRRVTRSKAKRKRDDGSADETQAPQTRLSLLTKPPRIPARSPGASRSDSDSDLPDAFSLLKTPAARKKKRPAVQSRAGRKLVRSASEVVSPSKAAGIDSDADAGSAALRIPGEPVLAYSLRKYYPARILARPSPSRYQIEFFDGSHATLSRARILTMYEGGFYTCPLGAIRLVGDEPASQTRNAVERAAEQVVDLSKDFERDRSIFRVLVAEMEAIRPSLDALHRCPSDQIEDMAQKEARMAVFFGNDSRAKNRLSEQVARGCLNRAEFDFLGRLLSRWYTVPPLALLSPDTATAREDAGELKNDTSPRHRRTSSASSVGSDTSQATVPIEQDTNVAPEDPDLSAQSVQFIHEVLLPHAVKQLVVTRDSCSLEDSEHRMFQNGSDWVEQIMAARGVVHTSP
ncbi:hypothetical protein GGF46_002533 [Coemansia sp. RSA 552]|nr:hypothetical protein GGF46_002533 [Coemansia sp. RSA 552]